MRHWDSEKGDSGPRRSTPSQGLDHSLGSQAPADMLGEWGGKGPQKVGSTSPRPLLLPPLPPQAGEASLLMQSCTRVAKKPSLLNLKGQLRGLDKV